MNFTSNYLTEIGWLKIEGTETEIHSIKFFDTEPVVTEVQPEIARKLNSQLDEYFRDNTWTFDVKLSPQGTEFQKKVWKELSKIPFGKTLSYQDLAKNIGNEKTIRAAASANGKNPIAILIPCHRVIGKNGSLTGYAGGIHRKKFLLELEKGTHTPILF